jgi:hypothetical protein
MEFTDDELAMVKAAATGLDGPGVEQFVTDVEAELAALDVPVTKNHIRAACTKVLAQGK